MKECILSVKEKSSGFTYEIIVVDDGSTDGSVEMLTQEFPDIRLVVNERNLGVSRSYNRGVAEASGRYVQMLNTDMKFIHNAIKVMLDFLEHHPEAAACAGKLRNIDMSPQISYGNFPSMTEALVGALFLTQVFPRARLPRRGILPQERDREPIETEYLCGADMLVRKSVIDTIGFFDERYTSYCEETDFCYRVLHETPLKLFYVPDAEIVHFGGMAFKDLREFQIQLIYSSYDKFLRKHHSALYSMITRWLYAFQYGLKTVVRFLGFLFHRRTEERRSLLEATWHVRYALFPRDPPKRT